MRISRALLGAATAAVAIAPEIALTRLRGFARMRNVPVTIAAKPASIRRFDCVVPNRTPPAEPPKISISAVMIATDTAMKPKITRTGEVGSITALGGSSEYCTVWNVVWAVAMVFGTREKRSSERSRRSPG